jgi:CHASE1-domain containing sensor protein
MRKQRRQQNNMSFNKRASVDFIQNPNENKVLFKVDGLVLILSIILLTLGIGVGLLCFFLLQNKEVQAAQGGLYTLGQNQADQLQKIITSTERVVRSVQALFTVNNATVNFYNQFLPYIDISQSFVPGILALSYSPVVYAQDVNTFVQNVRTWGSAHANFTITTRDALNNVIPSPPAALYMPVLEIAPLAPNRLAIGYDSAASTVRYNAITRANASRSISTTGKTVVATAISKISPGTLLYAPVYDTNNNFVGATSGVFQIDALVLVSATASVLHDIIVVLFDDGVNATLPDQYFLYSSISNGQAGYGNVSTMTTQDHLNVVKNAPLITSQNIVIGDRNWTACFVATNSFMIQYQVPDKWIALFTPIVVCAWIVIIIVTVSIMKRLQYVSEIKSLSKQKVELLQESQSKLNELLNRISEAESNVRLAMNEINGIVMVVDELGRTLEVNDKFKELLKYVERDTDCMDRIFPDVGKNLLQNAPHECVMVIRAHTYEELNVKVNVSKMGRWEGRAIDSYMIIMSISTTQNKSKV